MSLTQDDLDAVCGLVNDLCGVFLDETKGYLIESRLADLVAREGCESYVALAEMARTEAATGLRTEIVDAITTNETLFFRDNSPFDALRHKVIPHLLDASAKSSFPNRIRIWSAACSAGQETYSIAMTIRELIPNLDDYNITILGTDVSDAAIAKASRGRYAKHEVERGLSPKQLADYFVAVDDGWQVRDELRAMVSFQRLDLREPFDHLGHFDVVFCRNVAIYFTAEARRDVFDRITRVLQPEGALFVGSSETLHDLGPAFEPLHHCRAVFYRPTTATPRHSEGPSCECSELAVAIERSVR